MKPKIVKVGHVGLTVRDIDRTIDFYCKYLGMQLTERFDYEENKIGHGVAVRSGAFIRCNTTHHELSIFKMRSDIDVQENAGSGKSYGLHHIAFEIASAEELLALFRSFRDGGEEIVNCRIGGPGNQPRFYVKDPDGNLLEFYYGIDQVGWTGVPRPYVPIQEIDLLDFDFDAFQERRESDGKTFRAKLAS